MTRSVAAPSTEGRRFRARASSQHLGVADQLSGGFHDAAFFLFGQSSFDPVPLGVRERWKQQGVVHGLAGMLGHVLLGSDQLPRSGLLREVAE
jgi:hypothetical protein